MGHNLFPTSLGFLTLLRQQQRYGKRYGKRHGKRYAWD